MPADNLLVVDDSPEDCAQISQVLGQQFTVFCARSGREALKMLDDQEIHIVLLDMAMPGMDGYEVCQEIRRKYPGTPIQVVLMSGTRESYSPERVIEVGADDFIRRDESMLELQARVGAARIRLQNQTSLLNEKEFYKKAMAEEERLSSIIMDQNRDLRQAYDRIKKLNQKLEKANKQLEKISTYDALSGLLNRRSMFEKINVELDRNTRLKLPLSGIMLDIDHFKQVNDNHGHNCGDVVIRNIGKVLRDRLRRYDDAGRYGGEEFFVILPNTSQRQAAGIAERFRKEFEQMTHTCDDTELQVTVSMGVAEYLSDESREEWLMRADEAMYRAKQAGRNRTFEA